MRSNHSEDSKTFDALSYLVIGLYFILLIWSARVPWLTDWQTSLSSAHTITAGKHFAEDGFITCKFLPILQPGKLYGDYYTHYPPFSEIINGVVRKLGFDSLFSFRLPPIIFATAALLFWFLFVKNLYNSKAAFLCVFLLAILPENYIGALSPHIFSFDQFFRFAALYLIYLLFNVEEINKKRTSILLWLVMFFQSITSLEYILYLQLYLWLYAVFFNVPKKKKLIWFFTAPVLGLFLHLVQDIWAVGVSGLLLDIVKTFNFKAGFVNENHSVELLRSFKMYFWNFLRITEVRKSDYLLILFVMVVAASMFELKKYYKINRFLRYMLVFSMSESVWYIFFPRHALVHIHVIRLLFPSTTLLIGVLFYANLKSIKEYLNSRRIWLLTKAFIIVSIFLLLYGLKIHRLTEAVEQNAIPVKAYKFRELKNLLPDDAICLTGFFHYDATYMRYYLDRRTYAIPTERIDISFSILEKESLFIKDKLYYIYYPAFKSTDCKNIKEFEKLINEKVLIYNHYTKNRLLNILHFNTDIINEDQLKERLVQLGISDMEPILELWRKSVRDIPETTKKYLPPSARYLFTYKDFLYVYKLF